MTPTPLNSEEARAAATRLNDDSNEQLLYCVRAFTAHRQTERARLLHLFDDGLEVECAGAQHFIPFLTPASQSDRAEAHSLDSAIQATSLEAMKRLGVWPPRRVATWTVAQKERLGAHFYRMTFALNDDTRHDWRPGDCCRFDSGGDLSRPYTLRRLTDGEKSVLVDVYCHEQTPGSEWAASLAPGAEVTVRGERHELFPDFAAGETWLLGDETALPTIAALLETWTAPHALRVFLAVRDAADRAYLADVPLPPQASVTWVPGLVGMGLLTAAALTPPAAVWAAGELGVIAMLKKELKTSFPQADIRTIGYWRATS